MKYIQLIGTQRSGSNLLRLMLNQLMLLPLLILHIFFLLLPVLEKYGNLKTSKNLNNLILDVCKWIKLNPIKWKNFDVSINMIKSNLKNLSIFQVFSSIYEIYAEQSNSESLDV